MCETIWSLSKQVGQEFRAEMLYTRTMLSRIFATFIVLSFVVTDCWTVSVLQDGSPYGPLAPAIKLSGTERTQLFSGDLTQPDYFHQVLIDSGSLIVAARNVIYNISSDTFQENWRIEWSSSSDDVQFCMLRQKSPEECQNYIRVVVKRSDNKLLICGTNAFRPVCRTYTFDESQGYTVEEVESGVGRCPYDPSHNSTFVYVDKHLYSATVADLSARDALIYRKPMRTEQHDSQWLNDPNFVSSFTFDNKVYFFFREMAVENINCGKAVFSRVGRVCVNDQGGARVLKNTWTSFFKSRLNCSIPGDFPFYFDEIQSTSQVGEGNVFPTLIPNDRLPMVYGVFTTPRNGIRGSAICAYKMSDVISSFEGAFKEQRTPQSNWLPVRDSDVPDVHPAKSCNSESLTLSDQTLNFIKSHPLMDRAVPAFGGQPIIVQSSLEYSFTQIAVDWQVYSADFRYYDVLFIGTDNGRVLKAINKGRGLHTIDPAVIEVISVFDDGLPVTNLYIHRHPSNRHLTKLIVTSRDEIRAIPLHRCHLRLTCSDCVALRDPYCSWVDNKCAYSTHGLQSIESGRHARCPVPIPVMPSAKTAKPTSSARTSTDSVTCPVCVCKERRRTRTTPIVAAAKTTASVFATKLRTSTSTPSSHLSELDQVEGVLDEVEDGEVTWPDAIGPCYGQSLDGGTVVVSDAGGYSGSWLAAVAVLCTFVSMVVGFFIGFAVSWYRCYKQHRVDINIRPLSSRKFLPKDDILSGPSHAQPNLYNPEPTRKPSFKTFNKDTSSMDSLPPPPPPLMKQQNTSVSARHSVNMYVNDIKPNNSMGKLPNSYAETSLRAPPRKHRTVHL